MKSQIAISFITSTTLLGISTSAADSANGVVAATQTKQVRPTRLTAKEISQVKQTLSGKKLFLDHAFRVNLPDFGNCVFVPVQEFSPRTSPKKNVETFMERLYKVSGKRIFNFWRCLID
ncbi:hypothetical protein [Nostoc sp. PCC 7524]|uniref:hypothetical protein n=1 Tax=Nostoc sp. (strain ATCC 29411 / PCC 7524) TaxID=28072 RepID=UPI0005A1180B|nr:hypothetical protein [Nostoc sp. PCC 7524]